MAKKPIRLELDHTKHNYESLLRIANSNLIKWEKARKSKSLTNPSSLLILGIDAAAAQILFARQMMDNNPEKAKRSLDCALGILARS